MKLRLLNFFSHILLLLHPYLVLWYAFVYVYNMNKVMHAYSGLIHFQLCLYALAGPLFAYLAVDNWRDIKAMRDKYYGKYIDTGADSDSLRYMNLITRFGESTLFSMHGELYVRPIVDRQVHAHSLLIDGDQLKFMDVCDPNTEPWLSLLVRDHFDTIHHFVTNNKVWYSVDRYSSYAKGAKSPYSKKRLEEEISKALEASAI